jgi:hypothetical protein
MPARQSIWQVRRNGSPSTVAAHSKQMPMPHNGARGSPRTDLREGIPACSSAAATVMPDVASMHLPSTTIVIAEWTGCSETIDYDDLSEQIRRLPAVRRSPVSANRFRALGQLPIVFETVYFNSGRLGVRI